MRKFDEAILDRLGPTLGREPIYYVGLGAFDFQFAFGKLERVQNLLRVDFGLRKIQYTWESGPTDVPAWLLINQIPMRVALEKPTELLIEFVSGDWVRLHTEECAYECQIFKWAEPDKDGIAIEIY